MSMEIIKQLYDVGNLFDRVENLNVIKNTFYKFVEAELKYRSFIDYNKHDVINDIYQTALTIASRGKEGKGNFEQLNLGIQRIKTYIFSESFNIEKAIVLASKAAYLATLIKTNTEIIEKYSNPLQMKDWIIDKRLNTKLNKLKKSNPEAFFYWYKIYQLKLKEN